MPRIAKVSDIKANLLRPATTSHFEVTIVEIPIIGPLNHWRGVGKQDKINLMCCEASLPGSNLATFDINNDRTGVTEKHVHRRIFDDRIDLSFYVDAGLYQPIKFFEEWMSYITHGRFTRNTRQQRAASENELTEAKKDLQDLEINESHLQKYVREVELTSKIYETFLQRMKETDEVKELQSSNVKVIQAALLPAAPISPNISQITFMFYLFSLFGLYSLLAYFEFNRNAVVEPSYLELFDIDNKRKELLFLHYILSFISSRHFSYSSYFYLTGFLGLGLSLINFKTFSYIFIHSAFFKFSLTSLNLIIIYSHFS